MNYKQLQNLPKDKVKNLKNQLREVLELIEKDGSKILPYLCDTDDNPGQRLREAMVECHIYEL